MGEQWPQAEGTGFVPWDGREMGWQESVCRHGLAILGHRAIGRTGKFTHTEQDRACNCRISNWAAAGLWGQEKSGHRACWKEGAGPALDVVKGWKSLYSGREWGDLGMGGQNLCLSCLAAPGGLILR